MTQAPTAAPTSLRPLRTVRSAAVRGKSVLVRSDLNVPLAGGEVADDTRIRAAIPTLELLRARGARRITVCSHLGRPKTPDPAFRIDPVAQRLHELFAGEVTVLENTRFDAGETSNELRFAHALADGHDLFVQDAFGSVHRAHASTVGVAHLLPSYAGLLVEQEIAHLGRLLDAVERPFVLLAGGAKAEDKLRVLAHLGARADRLLVGGKLAEQLRVTQSPGLYAELPVDVVAAPSIDAAESAAVFAAGEVPYGWAVVDIGPRARADFAEALAGAGTIFWNGPVGMFELPEFEAGTRAVAEAVAVSGAYSVAGGGDTVRALNAFGLADSVSWVSTGGGAALELLEGRELPGLEVIPSP